MVETNKRFAVVTGSNRGIGLEICRQLASNGVFVVLTSRDEKRGIEAVENLKNSGLSNVVFHQLDLLNPTSISTLADFIKTQFGKLDILVNNAAITSGTIVDVEGFKAKAQWFREHNEKLSFKENILETYELAEECLKTNYYGVKAVTEALTPFLQLSHSPRVVIVSSSMGQLKNFSNEKAKEILSNVDELTEERIEEVLKMFLKDFKQGLSETKGWPDVAAYTISKSALNAYTRVLAKKFPSFRVNCVCPGFVKTDLNLHTGLLTVEEGAKNPVSVALLPDEDKSSGLFFVRGQVAEF